MIPFNPALAIPGTVLRDVEAASLLAGRDLLKQGRIDDQHDLLATNTPRWDMIEVNRAGVIFSGNHGARAAAERGLPVDVLIRDLPLPSTGPILSIRVLPR